MTMLNKREAAELLGVKSTKTVERMVARGEIAQYRPTPGTVMFSKEEIEAHIKGSRVVKVKEEKSRKKSRRATVKVNESWRPGEKLV